jgi:hypothetical protein
MVTNNLHIRRFSDHLLGKSLFRKKGWHSIRHFSNLDIYKCPNSICPQQTYHQKKRNFSNSLYIYA